MGEDSHRQKTELADARPLRLISRVSALARRVAHRFKPVLPIALPMVYLIWALGLCLALADSGRWVYADSTAEWLAGSAAHQGIDPYADLKEVAARFGVPYSHPAISYIGDADWVHPRTPGALLLFQPFTLIPPEQLYVVLAGLSLAVLGYLAVRRFPAVTQRPWLATVAMAGLVMLSGPMVRSLQFGAMVLVVVTFVWLFWDSVRAEDSWWGGVWLGLAMTMRVFPGLLLVVAVLARRPRASLTAVGTFLGTSLIALLVFDLSAATALWAMMDAGTVWLDLPSNGSLVPLLTGPLDAEPALVTAFLIAAAFALLAMVARVSSDVDLLVCWGVVLMVLVSPLSWEAYDLFLLIPLAVAVRKTRPFLSPAIVWIWGAVSLVGFHLSPVLEASDPSWAGRRALIMRLVILAGLALATIKLGRGVREPAVGPQLPLLPGSPRSLGSNP